MSRPTHNQRTAAGRGVSFSSSPVLEVRLPVWRSRLVLFFLFGAFFALMVRALFLQGMNTEFLQKQGATRYARTIELPATRGKITDRNGQVLASSIPVKAVSAFPEDVVDAPKEKLLELARLLEMSEAAWVGRCNALSVFVQHDSNSRFGGIANHRVFGTGFSRTRIGRGITIGAFDQVEVSQIRRGRSPGRMARIQRAPFSRLRAMSSFMISLVPP